jgi:hypothetical protein
VAGSAAIPLAGAARAPEVRSAALVSPLRGSRMLVSRNSAANYELRITNYEHTNYELKNNNTKKLNNYLKKYNYDNF